MRLWLSAASAGRQCALPRQSGGGAPPLKLIVRRRVIQHSGTGTAGILAPLIPHL